MLTRLIFAIFLSVAFLSPDIVDSKELSGSEIRKIMIQESIASYSGNCPCPYNSARNGSRCGKRSAWSRAGGYSPLCYDTDISDALVEEFRARNK